MTESNGFRRRGTSIAALLMVMASVLAACSGDSEDVAGGAVEEVTAVKGTACGYYTNVGLFGGPQNLRGCGQPPNGPATAASPLVALPPEGSAAAMTANDPDGAAAQYGPAVIFGGKWPDNAAAAPPSGPISVSTQGTPDGTVTSSARISLHPTPVNINCYTGFQPPCTAPGGYGPFPVEGDDVLVECTASKDGITGSTTLKNATLATSTNPDGEPKDVERVPDKPPVNYTKSGVITNVGDVFSVVYNEHIVNADGSLTVNGAHMYLFGPTAVGEVVKGQVTCGTSPSPLSTKDTVAPSCGRLVIAPVSPEDPTPKVPRTELIGVFDSGGLQSIDDIQATNAKVDVGNPDGMPYLQFQPGQTGPLPVTATRIDESKPMSWSFDATDRAGNRIHCPT